MLAQMTDLLQFIGKNSFKRLRRILHGRAKEITLLYFSQSEHNLNRRFNFAFVSFSTVLVGMLLIGTVLGRSASQDDAYKQLGVFTEVLSRIKSDYVEEPDLKGVTLGAVNGLLESVDPYASYLSADQYKQYLKAKDQKRGDVGLILSKRFGYIGVVDSVRAGTLVGVAEGDWDGTWVKGGAPATVADSRLSRPWRSIHRLGR